MCGSLARTVNPISNNKRQIIELILVLYLYVLINNSTILYTNTVVTLENAKGERPREVAIRFANVGCIAILSPKSPAADWEGEEAELDYPPPISLERARERMEKAYSTLEVAKTRFRELGGELPEDREIELLKVDHQRLE